MDFDSLQQETSSGNEATPDDRTNKNGCIGRKIDIDNLCIGCLEFRDLDEMTLHKVGDNSIVLIYEELTKNKLDTTKVQAAMCSVCILELSKAYQFIKLLQFSYMLLEEAAQKIGDLQNIEILESNVYSHKKREILQDMLKEKFNFTERMNFGKVQTEDFTKNEPSCTQDETEVVGSFSDDDAMDNLSDHNDDNFSSDDDISLAERFNIKVVSPVKQKKVKEINKNTPSIKKNPKKTRKKSESITRKDTVKIECKEELPELHSEVVLKAEDPEREDMEDVEGEENTDFDGRKGRRPVKSKKQANQLECNKCGATFNSYVEAETHFKFTHNSESTCILCDKEYTNSYSVLYHLMMKHGKLKCCRLCLVSFPNSKDLHGHYKSEEHNTRCTVCEEQFKNRKALYEHRRKKHLNPQLEQLKFKCPECPKEFANQNNIKRHCLVAHNDLRFLCDTCGQSYTTKRNLQLHILKFHEGVQIETKNTKKNFFCEACGRELKIFHKYAIAMHIAKHKGHNYVCKKCYETFESEDLFKKHVEELGHQLFECHKCQSQFVREENFKIHLKNHDAPGWNKNMFATWGKSAKLRNERGEFVCSYCPKVFKDKQRLDNHVRVHTNERPYKCHICGKGFKTWIHRKTHLNIHLGIKKWVCKYCAKAFTNSCTLKGHEMIHTGERPHRCPECKKGFITMSAMKKHRMVHYRSGGSNYGKKANRIAKNEEKTDSENEENKEFSYEYGPMFTENEVPYASLVEEHSKA